MVESGKRVFVKGKRGKVQEMSLKILFEKRGK
jgi:hypothetical protein